MVELLGILAHRGIAALFHLAEDVLDRLADLAVDFLGELLRDAALEMGGHGPSPAEKWGSVPDFKSAIIDRCEIQTNPRLTATASASRCSAPKIRCCSAAKAATPTT